MLVIGHRHHDLAVGHQLLVLDQHVLLAEQGAEAFDRAGKLFLAHATWQDIVNTVGHGSGSLRAGKESGRRQGIARHPRPGTRAGARPACGERQRQQAQRHVGTTAPARGRQASISVVGGGHSPIFPIRQSRYSAPHRAPAEGDPGRHRSAGRARNVVVAAGCGAGGQVDFLATAQASVQLQAGVAARPSALRPASVGREVARQQPAIGDPAVDEAQVVRGRGVHEVERGLPGQRVGAAGAGVHRFPARRVRRVAQLAAKPELGSARAQRPLRGGLAGHGEIILRARVGDAVRMQRRWQPVDRHHPLDERADRGPGFGRREDADARVAVAERQRLAQGASRAAAVVVAQDEVGGPVLVGPPLQPPSVKDVEVGAVVLVERLLHHVVQAPSGWKRYDPHAPRCFRRAVFNVRLINRALAVLQPDGPGA